MKRLIIKSELETARKIYNDWESKTNYIEIYKNPTPKEIQNCRDGIENDPNLDKSVRGIINKWNDVCWRGDILHDTVGEDRLADTTGFRFAIDSNCWFFDAYNKYTLKEVCTDIIKYKDTLNKYDSLDKTINFGYLKGNDTNISFNNYSELLKYVETSNE
jgi:hypothetical protein